MRPPHHGIASFQAVTPGSLPLGEEPMGEPHKPETTAPSRKRRAKPSAPVAARAGPAAAILGSVSGPVPARGASPSARATSRPSAVPTRAAPAGAIVNRRAADHLRSGHLWVYASDVVSVTLPKPEETLLPVADQRGIFLGTALYSPASQIALRLVSRETLDHAAWLKLLAARLHAAIARRKPMLDAANDACRLCFSEADELPGLIVDKYGEIVVVQRLAIGLLHTGVAEACVRVLREELAPAAIFERPDPRIRELEGLPAPSPDPLWVGDSVSITTAARPVAATEFYLNGLVFQYDANAGQKTGAFLDQRTNYAAAQQWAQRLGANGRALDVCSCQNV